MKIKIVYMVFAILVIALLFVVENFLLSSIYRVKNNFTPNVAQLAVATTDFCVIDNSLLRKKLI